MAVPVAVVGCEEPDRLYPVARLLEGLAGRGFGRGFAYVRPASRQGPALVARLLDEEDAAFSEHHSPYVHLRGRGACFEREQISGFLQGHRGMGCEYLGRQIPELLVAPEVVVIFRVGQAVLGYGLQTPGPPEPLLVAELIVVSRRYTLWHSLAEFATDSTLCCSATHGYGIQPCLYLFPALFQERWEGELLAEVGGILVGGEAGAVSGDLEEHPARLVEVDRTEVEAVYLPRYPETETPDLLPPRRVLLVIGRPESDVVHAAATQVGPRRVGTFDHPDRRPRTSVSDLEGHLLASVLGGISHLAEAEYLGEDPCSGIQLPDRQVDGPETPDPHLPRDSALLPRNPTRHSSTLVSRET